LKEQLPPATMSSSSADTGAKTTPNKLDATKGKAAHRRAAL
jgi:hypothetical protein